MGSSRNKILFSDLDGTLLNDEKEIGEDTRDAIEELLKEGHFFAICTGRALASAKAVAARYRLDRKGCYIIAYNGGVIYDPATARTISYSPVPLPLVRKLFEKAEEAGLHIHTFGEHDTVLAKHDTPELDVYMKKKGLAYQVGENVLDGLAKEPAKVMLINLTNLESLIAFQKENASWAEPVMTSCISYGRNLEYCAAGVSKGAALRQLCNYLHVPLEESVAIGDDGNDISMLQDAGIAVVPSNAYVEARAYADYICAKDNNSGAVLEAISRFFL